MLNDHLYVYSYSQFYGEATLAIRDLSTPEDTVWRITLAAEDVRSILTYDRYLMLVGWHSLRILDCADPLQPVLVTEFPLPFASECKIDGDYLFMNAQFEGIGVWDLSQLPTLHKIYSATNLEFILDVVPDGDRALAVLHDRKFAIYDWTVEAQPVPDHVTEIGRNLLSMFSGENNLYGNYPSYQNHLLNSYRTGDHRPIFQRSFYTSGITRDMGFIERIGYLVGDPAFLDVWDFSDPENPTKLAGIELDVEAEPICLLVSDPWLLVAGGSSQFGSSGHLLVFDIRRPRTPRLVADHVFQARIRDMVLTENGTLALCIGSRWLQTRDARTLLRYGQEPPSLEILGGFELPFGEGRGLAARGEMVYGHTVDEVFAVNCSNPMSPILAESRVAPQSLILWSSEYYDDVYYVLSEGSGVMAYDVRNASGMTYLGNYNLPSYCYALVETSGKLWASTLTEKLWEVPLCALSSDHVAIDPETGDECSPSVSFSTLSIAPNPWNPATEIHFFMTEPGPATLKVYDLQGRQMANLLDRSLSVGTHAVPWDGRDGAGRILPAGGYLVRLCAGDRLETQKIMLVK